MLTRDDPGDILPESQKPGNICEMMIAWLVAAVFSKVPSVPLLVQFWLVC